MKTYSTLLIIRELQIKTIMSYYLISTRMAIIKQTKKLQNNNCWQGCGEMRTLSAAGRNIKWHSHYEKQYGNSLKN